MTEEIENVEITLAAGDLRLKASPFGASLRGLWRETPDGTRQEIITGYTGAKGKVGGQGDVLIPFPGRVREGRYTFEGREYQMNRNDKDGPNAIHGFLRLTTWEIVSHSEDAVAFIVNLDPDANPGYPFALRASVTYTVTENAMACHFGIQNIGSRKAPVAAGFHPYFTVGSAQIDLDTLQVPMAATLDFENLLPTGKIVPVDGTEFDFRTPRSIGTTQFNTCYSNPLRDADGMLRLRLAAQGENANGNERHGVTVWMDSAFNYIVLYSGDPLPPSHRRRALAIEPMTCGSDAFNHAEWGLVALEPDEIFMGAWGVEA